MSEVSLDTEAEVFDISSYNGDFSNKEEILLENPTKRVSDSPLWNFYREDDNYSYIGGKIHYEGDCRNNLIISPYRENRIINVKNAFILIKDGCVEISPIFDVLNAISKGEKILSGRKISYNIPRTVFERENLIERNEGEIRSLVLNKYGIETKRASVIKMGVYRLEGKQNKDYILKFISKEKERAESLLKIAQDIPDYFPKVFRRKDSPSELAFSWDSEFYELEGFVSSFSSRKRDIEYFLLLGHHLGLLHQQLSRFSQKNIRIDKILTPKSKYTDESTLISVYLDLVSSGQKGLRVISDLEKIIDEDFSSKMRSFPQMLIHRDLNRSNLIWDGDSFKIIDLETVRRGVRLEEFESPLLFEGNLGKPSYIENSTDALVFAYNQSSENPLSREEINTLPSLLKYALLRNFVVRKIRRGAKDGRYFSKLERNLDILRSE